MLTGAGLGDVLAHRREVLLGRGRVEGAAGEDLEETRGHVERLEQAFDALDMKPKGKHCSGMAGILEEGADLLEQDGAEPVLDAGFIAGCQRVEHYEMAAYGTSRSFADALGETEVVGLLTATYDEEVATDKKLTTVSKKVNKDALNASESED